MIPYQKLFRRNQLRILAQARKIAPVKGQRVYLVGGTVRDLLLGRPEVDLDLAVEGDGLLFARELARQLGGRLAFHDRFLTATVYWGGERVDVVTTRQEYYPRPGALPEVEPATLEADLARRDFSVNAMALPLMARDLGEILDPFGGREDLARQTLRVLHRDSFRDDPTRLLRGVRFATRLKFIWEEETCSLVRQALAGGYLDLLEPKRLWQEFILLLKERRPVAAWESLIDLGWQGLPGAGLPDVAAGRRAEKLLCQWKWRGQRPLDASLVYFLIATVKLRATALEEVLDSVNFGRKKRNLISAARDLLPELAPCLARGSLPECLPAGPRMAPEALIFILAVAGWSRLPARVLP
ncbi:Poly A polymerase, head domain [Moorella glycerini]|uniref:Multifunctional CCA protein n=1 Tax=Neomoorella stamsii TaxID=1266720 RepID=A0A9X7J3A9_9FIRM|nr:MULTISPECIES: CCA tRNA nucleotidyltransferase [Moorella]PRR72714.1 Multifunctional CCA protein [Moorella stamsii]CEP68059.1 Poly A polymerase, head domain [Moorella glycerini]